MNLNSRPDMLFSRVRSVAVPAMVAMTVVGLLQSRALQLRVDKDCSEEKAHVSIVAQAGQELLAVTETPGFKVSLGLFDSNLSFHVPATTTSFGVRGVTGETPRQLLKQAAYNKFPASVGKCKPSQPVFYKRKPLSLLPVDTTPSGTLL
ncbi:MAG TPA: hypothetical protein VGN16_13680 [Acidobacteriaceae bacterium]|jgi:hypothetical protein